VTYAPLIHREGEREKCLAKVQGVAEQLVEALHRTAPPHAMGGGADPWRHWLERLRHAVGKWHEPLHTALEIVPEHVRETSRVRIRVRVHWEPMSWVEQEGTAWNPNLDPPGEEPLVERVDWDGDDLVVAVEINDHMINAAWISHLAGRHVILPDGLGWLPPLPGWNSEMDNQAFAKRMALKRRRRRAS
jgi:hypothetical protein